MQRAPDGGLDLGEQALALLRELGFELLPWQEDLLLRWMGTCGPETADAVAGA